VVCVSLTVSAPLTGRKGLKALYYLHIVISLFALQTFSSLLTMLPDIGQEIKDEMGIG
jgi:hypothetical protein